MAITTLVLDFDGTCTDIPSMNAGYLDACFAYLVAHQWPIDRAQWLDALEAVRGLSPDRGWRLNGGLPSAPAAADPYILSGEAVEYLREKLGARDLPGDVYGAAYKGHTANLRAELTGVLEAVVARGIEVWFVSNTSTTKLVERLEEVFAKAPALRGVIRIRGGAQKYAVTPAQWEGAEKLSPAMQGVYRALPEEGAKRIARPIYLRRGHYVSVLDEVWAGDPARAASTIVCGDVWELDLALPAHLGCKLHSIDRALPYVTYAYEHEAAKEAGATHSPDLSGLRARIEAEAVTAG